ncbi:MAG: phospholipase D-like domain-containing protein [Segniliparus sp.]|uniref:phospholipase D-like domain-containing protein n=1 Tax=Segniliparus sp. TaxID=2804064 RepID=UPI003F34A599
MPVVVKPYLSPTLVLLAYDWPEGRDRGDFLGFAIERTPGLAGSGSSWLPNRIGFDGPNPDQSDIPSDQAPIQKFYWWDARIDDRDRGSAFTYKVVPVVGEPGALELLDEQSTTIQATVPEIEEHGIGSYFNRAVVSSQAFSKQFPDLSTQAQREAAEAWLGNGMQLAVPQFLERASGKAVDGAIYHLTDPTWILPALKSHDGPLSLAYNQTSSDHASDAAIQELISSGRAAEDFAARTHANIMHNKFLVRADGDTAEAVLTGSANFTPEGLSAQANLLHTFESPALAALYLARQRELAQNPGLAATRKTQTGWSAPVQVGDATIRAFFPPEPTTERRSLDTVVDAIKAAQHSVLLCAYDPTDGALLDAFVQAADSNKMALALVNKVPTAEPTGDPSRADVAASITIFKQAQEHHDIVGFNSFKASDTPDGFAPERVLWPGEDPKIMVRVHHKFVVVDAEGDNPVVFTGSANFSNNSLHNNDENFVEITNSPRLAGIYLAEFLRLFEHYRARMAYNRREAGDPTSFTLTSSSAWAAKYYAPGSVENNTRQALAGTS